MNKILRKIPKVDAILKEENIKKLLDSFDRNFVLSIIRRTLEDVRTKILSEQKVDLQNIIFSIENEIKQITTSPLKKVINGTGILLHTNLGRACIGEDSAIASIANNYSNLEFNLQTGKRDFRDNHIKKILRIITNSEDAIVVNNNAAAVLLVLSALSNDKEVIVSRGELIEIGGSFRLPDIINSSGARMVEVGTTNKTKISDFENAITQQSAMILKSHKSNFTISGFTEEVSLEEMVKIAKINNLISYYDLGSGLLQKMNNLNLPQENDVSSAINYGVDLLSFSSDKLLGGPQAGVICGKSELISIISRHPLMRVLRVGKLTYASLISTFISHLRIKKNHTVRMLVRPLFELRKMAILLSKKLQEIGVNNIIISDFGFSGGGTLPQNKIESVSLKILMPKKNHFALMNIKFPIITNLIKGEIILNLFAIYPKQINEIVEGFKEILPIFPSATLNGK